MYVHQVLVNVTFFGNRVFADTMSQGPATLGWALNPMASILVRGPRETQETEKKAM